MQMKDDNVDLVNSKKERNQHFTQVETKNE